MRFLYLLLISAFFSCANHSAAPDVSGIKTEVHILRFDNDFFSADTARLQQAMQQLQTKYPAFLPLYFQFFAPVKDIAQQQDLPFDSALLKYYRFIKPLYQTVQQRFADVGAIEADLAHQMKYVKHYYPGFTLPAVLTSVESLNPENPTEIYGTTYYHDTLIISLQMFLGRDYPAYDPAQYPDYLRRRFTPQYIVPNCMRAIALELYSDSTESAALIERMIEKGKQWWLLKRLMPDAPDSLITGYSAQQSAWVKANESEIWGSINQSEDLYSTEQTAIQNYIGESPFTQTLPHGNNGEGAPGNIGPWVGWHIIEAFAKNNSALTMQQVLQTTARKIFEQAKYKP